MDDDFFKLNIKSSEEDILSFLERAGTKESKYFDIYLKYCTSLLDLKHQEVLFKDQNIFNKNVLKENRKLAKWTRWLVVVTFVLVIPASWQAYVLSTQIKDARTTESATLMLNFNTELRSGIYSSLTSDIDSGALIFQKKGGKYSEAVIDNYLVIWEMLDNVAQQDLISQDMLGDTFSYDIEEAYCNKEIKDFIQKARKDNGDQGLYAGFTDMAKIFLKQDKNPSCVSY